MSLTVKASFSVTGLPEGKGMSLPIMAGCALAVTILTFGGLGSVQNTYAGGDKVAMAPLLGYDGQFDASSSSKVFRYWWFVVCFQLVTCVTALWAVVAGKVNTYRAGLIGLFIVATVLNIQASDSWLNVSYTEVFSHDMLRDRTRTTVAGYIMSATLDALMLLGLGWIC